MSKTIKKEEVVNNSNQPYEKEKTSLTELSMLDSLIEDKLGEYIGGGCYEGYGRNFNFTFNGKPFLMRVSIDDFHYDLWKKNKVGYWSDDFDRNKLKTEHEIKSKTIRHSMKLTDWIPQNGITWRFKKFLKEKILYNILPIYYRYKLNGMTSDLYE